jgi:hypothetical protein
VKNCVSKQSVQSNISGLMRGMVRELNKHPDGTVPNGKSDSDECVRSVASVKKV